MNLRDSLDSGLFTFISALTVISILPLYGYYIPPFMILWGIAWLIENKFRINRNMLAGNKPAILFFLFIFLFLWQIAGLLYAALLNSGLERIIKRLSFLLFPLVLFYPGEKIKQNIGLLLKLFAILTLVYLVYCFGNAAHNSLSFQNGSWIFNPHPVEFDYENFFYGNRLSDKIHPSYLSMYVLLSAVISLESFFSRLLKNWKRFIWMGMSLIFLVTLYLLSSRAGILATIIVIPFYLFFKLYNKLSSWLIMFGIIVLIALFVLFYKTNTRISYSFEESNKESLTELWQNDIRYSIWKSAIGVIEDNWIFGVGTGDASDELKKEFLARGYTDGYYDNLNAHNQYLEIFLENGIIGLIIFLGLLGWMIQYAISGKNLLYGVFILMMIIFFASETILNRLSGITFFPLFSFLLIYYKSN